jgi:hypothetical protein
MLSWLNLGESRSFLWISVLMFVLGVLPSICIHLSYYFANRSMEFLYDYESREITIIKGSESKVFKLDDIERLVRSASYNLAANRAGFLPWDMYNHSVIFLKDGQRFIITSLLVPNLNLPIDGERITVKRNFFRMVLGDENDT